MKLSSRLDRAEKWADAHKKIPAFCVVGVVKEGVSLSDVSSFLELVDHEEVIPFDELFNAAGSIREGFQFRRFTSCNLSDVERLLHAFDIEARIAITESTEGCGAGSQPDASINRGV